MIAMSWHLHRKNTVGFRRNLFSPRFLLAVHMLTASKRRKENACCQGRAHQHGPGRPGSSSDRMRSARFQHTSWLLGCWQKSAVNSLVEERRWAQQSGEEALLSCCKTPHHRPTEHQDHHSADVGDATCP